MKENSCIVFASSHSIYVPYMRNLRQVPVVPWPDLNLDTDPAEIFVCRLKIRTNFISGSGESGHHHAVPVYSETASTHNVSVL